MGLIQAIYAPSFRDSICKSGEQFCLLGVSDAALRRHVIARRNISSSYHRYIYY